MLTSIAFGMPAALAWQPIMSPVTSLACRSTLLRTTSATPMFFFRKKGKRGVGRVRKGRSSRDKGLPKGRGGASVTVAEQMSGEGSEQRSGPAEAIVARRSSRPEMPGWLLKEGADEEGESESAF